MDITTPPGSSINNKTGGWRTYIPKTDFNTCIGCGTCARVCPETAITMNPTPFEQDIKSCSKNMSNGSAAEQAGHYKRCGIKSKTKPVTDMDYCKGCGLCATECPVKAIKMELENK